MDRYLLDIKADDKPVLLERVLRVIRHRGFIIKQVAATQNHESKIASVEIIVDSNRPITTLINQIEKLWDIRTIEVTELKHNELTNHNLQEQMHKEGMLNG
ncbi:Acetolactate synthase isozyme 2 small subunit [Vibrio thalassae]|uniref:Acetolactate synthase isozyme 2 small subunit n=1 Tax=Vibrio thalassae TaxID=1243014 RepID=A0A240EK10_9VIBR|nr:acetolactate synthase 2 small subunit [Vibrio thalassae]SNX48851.1 Acetolactate synthase isozyme 2 small subunit [Vibrio thalassae]